MIQKKRSESKLGMGPTRNKLAVCIDGDKVQASRKDPV